MYVWRRVRDAALAACCETHKIRRYGFVTLHLAFFSRVSDDVHNSDGRHEAEGS